MRNEFPLLDELVLRGISGPIDGKLIHAEWGESLDMMKHVDSLTPELVRLPFKTVWMEGNFYGTNYPLALRLQEVTTEKYCWAPPGAAEEGTQRYYTSSGGNREIAAWLFLPDEKGTHVLGPLGIYFNSEGKFKIGTPTNLMDEESISRACSYAMLACATSLALINCKNVGLDSRFTVSKPPSKKSRKPRKPSIEYHVIKLPSQGSRGDSGPVQNPGSMKYHMARGHFKTYTADKPLLGKIVGTYWWDAHVRGNKKNGEIVSSYEVSDG